MESFTLKRTEDGLFIDGFPDAAKAIKIDGPIAKKFSDLVLHQSDLEFAKECLRAINLVSNEPRVFHQALWRSAIIHYCKCFGASEARSQLNPKKIYKDEPEGAMLAFNHFKDLRNKHFIHDENSYAQCVPGAILNQQANSKKIEKIIAVSTFAETLDKVPYNNLSKLILIALDFVNAQYNQTTELLMHELEQLPYETLFSKPDLTFNVPTVEGLSKTRS